MSTETTLYPAKFFKADERGEFRAEGHTRFSSVKKTILTNNKTAHLKSCDDIILDPGASMTINYADAYHHIIIPLNGPLVFNCEGGCEKKVMMNELIEINGNNDEDCYIRNLDKKNQVNCLYLALGTGIPLTNSEQVAPVLTDKKNELGFSQLNGVNLGIGIYDQHTKGHYKLSDSSNDVFIYVIEGAFEINGQLLTRRDGLILWDTDAVEFDPVLDGARILVCEFSTSK